MVNILLAIGGSFILAYIISYGIAMLPNKLGIIATILLSGLWAIGLMIWIIFINN